MVANSTFLWPYNWPLDWPFWCNLLTEGVVSYEELGNAKKALSKKCASSVHPKNATELLLLYFWQNLDGFFAHFLRFCLPCKSYLCENCFFIRLSLFETQTLSVFFCFRPAGVHTSAKSFIWKPRTFPLGLSVEPIEQSCSKLFFFQLFS